MTWYSRACRTETTVCNEILGEMYCNYRYPSACICAQGWRSDRALAFYQCGPGSIPGPGVISGPSLLVLYSARKVFFPGTPVFPSPQKLTFDLICVVFS